MVLPALGALLRRLPGLLQRLIARLAAAGATHPVQKALLAGNVVLLSVAVRKLQRARFAASVRCVQQLDESGLAFLLRHQLPMWVKFPEWERGQFLQAFVTLAWPTFSRMVCAIIKKEVEERLGSHGEFGRVSFARLSFGSTPPVVAGLKGAAVQGEGEDGRLEMVIDIDIRWAGKPDVVMQLSGIPGAAVAVGTCQVEGVLRVVLSPIEEELPFLTGVNLSLLQRPRLDFDVRVLGGDVMSLPALGSWLRASVAGILQELMVWPENLGWRWGPSWDRQQEAAQGGGQALLAGERQRRRQLPQPLGVLWVEVVGAALEPRRSTFLGRLKPVSSRVSLLLPAAVDPAASLPGAAGSSTAAAAARAVLQKGLTSSSTCSPVWRQSFPFVVTSRHQVLHLLLSHKRGGVLAKGMVQALGADVPLGSVDVAVADILGEAAAHEEWSVQQMLLEAAKLEVAAAATAAAAAAAAAAGSDADSLAGYESAIDDEPCGYRPLSPASSTRSSGLGQGFASAALAAAAAHAAVAASDDDEGRWVRVERRPSAPAALSVSSSAAAAARQQQHWQQRQATPPPRAAGSALERRSAGVAGSPARARRLGPEETPPPPARTSSWRRSLTRSPSPERRSGLFTAALLDPAALMQLQMEQQKPEPKWLSAEGVSADVLSASTFTLAGLLAQAAEPTAAAAQPDSPRSAGSEEEAGWLDRLQRYILGRGEGEDEADEFAPSQAAVAGRLQLRLTWQPVEEEAAPAPLRSGPQDAQQQQQQQQQHPSPPQQQPEASRQQGGPRGHSLDATSPPRSARSSLQLLRDGSGAEAGPPAAGGGAAAGASPSPEQHPAAALQHQGSGASAEGAGEEAVQGVLAVRVAHTKLEYVAELSYPVLAVSIDRRPGPDQASEPAGPSPARAGPAPASAASSPAALPDRAAAAGARALAPAASAPPAVEQQGAAAPAAPALQQQQQQRWISMESRAGTRMGVLHWNQVFYIPATLSPADFQAGRVVVELGEAASATRYGLFGPTLYCLDASESFSDDVKVSAYAAIPLKLLRQRRRLSGKWRLKEATPGVAAAERLVLGDCEVQLGFFPLRRGAGAAGGADALSASLPLV